MKWRPPVKNPYRDYTGPGFELSNSDGYAGECHPEKCQGDAFEAGVTAMLEALLQLAIDSKKNT